MLKRRGPNVDDAAGSQWNISALTHEGAGLTRSAASVTCTSYVGKDFLELLPDLNRLSSPIPFPKIIPRPRPPDLMVNLDAGANLFTLPGLLNTS